MKHTPLCTCKVSRTPVVIAARSGRSDPRVEHAGRTVPFSTVPGCLVRSRTFQVNAHWGRWVAERWRPREKRSISEIDMIIPLKSIPRPLHTSLTPWYRQFSPLLWTSGPRGQTCVAVSTAYGVETSSTHLFGTRRFSKIRVGFNKRGSGVTK